jgi:hypothetical protein
MDPSSLTSLSCSNLWCVCVFPIFHQMSYVSHIIPFIPVALSTSAFSVLLLVTMEGEYLLSMVCLHALSLFAEWVGRYIQQIHMLFIHHSIYTVEPQSIVPTMIVFPHVPFAIFGPEWSSIWVTLFIPTSIVPRTIVLPHWSFVNHSPGAAFPAWIVWGKKKKIEAKYLLFALPSLWTINLAVLIMNDGS